MSVCAFVLFARWERRERQPRSPVRWRHDKFQEIEAEAEEMEAEQTEQAGDVQQNEK